MRPTFGPVLPGMHGRIRRDVVIGPVRWRPVFVVPLESRGVVLSLVAEEFPKFLMPRRVGDEAVPIVVANLMAEMSEKCPVRLVQILPNLLALRVVALFDVERDEPVRMAGKNARSFFWRAQKVKHDTVL